MNYAEMERFVTVIMAKGVELEGNLPQISMRLPLNYFLTESANLWEIIRSEVIGAYPQHASLLNRSNLAYRVIFRPLDNNASLPGFDDRSINTQTLTFWYGMDYQPAAGECVGMTRDLPWVYYLLPDPRYYNPMDYYSRIYVYDNAFNHLIEPGQTTTKPLPADNYLTNHLKMFIDICWVDANTQPHFNTHVHDNSIDSLRDKLNKAGLLSWLAST